MVMLMRLQSVQLDELVGRQVLSYATLSSVISVVLLHLHGGGLTLKEA